ncbi:MAG TPA: phenylalanine--tRNA ligase subunit beta [Candidatus Acidoferrales bacterium]|nr:phenylalanine--tRNA ligase subunit beta [Candidatus Acidoferrales bacterium]
MKVLYPWLKQYVDAQASAAELRARLSLVGLPIDSIEETTAGPVLDAEVTANRPDCLGHYGVAREVAAIFRLPLKPIRPALSESEEKAAGATRVEIECPDLCPRFTARVIRGVKVQPSPEWLRKYLEAIGQNSINNIVDITNFIMFDLGQPQHAYDLEKLADRRIVVRRARPGEKLRTLDGIERALTKDTCVIADAARAIGVGGVMGGAESEISFSTRNILLESACFDPVSVRRTAKALGLRTEASYRFERGADPEMAEVASQRAAELILELAGGELLSGVVDVYPGRQEPQKIEFTRKELLRVMGADVPDRDIEEILSALGCRPVRVDANRGSAGSLVATWECRRPSWRCDLTRGIDLVEEVARLYGYDKFPPRMPPAKLPAHRLPHAAAQDRLLERLIALGYQEILEIPLVNKERNDLFRAEDFGTAVISNPLAEDASVMRSTGIVSMLGALEWNLNHGQRDLRLFEIGKAYGMRSSEPVETMVLTLGATGLAREKTIHEPQREFEFADLKGDIDRIGEIAGEFTWTAGGPAWLSPTRAAAISLGQAVAAEPLGVAGQLARRIGDQFKFRQEVYVAELRLEPLLVGIEKARAALRFVPLPRFPAVERDFSLVLADGVAFSKVAETIRALGIAELQSIEPADLFRGGQVPAGKSSLMIRVKFQSAQATLTDAQLNDFTSRIVGALEHHLGATLRSS